MVIYFKNGQGKVDEEFATKLRDLMIHRGPDGFGLYLDQRIILGHRRLAIIDLSDSGRQPMVSGDGNLQIVFNGEIYNYIEIRENLKKRGVVFKSESDTEVLLESYNQFGKSFLSDLNGMFAFIIWNQNKEELFIARDRYGIKPLYYIETDEIIAFASEIKSLLPLLPNMEVNDEIVYDYLASGRVDHLDHTFFLNVHRFPAGHYGVVKSDGFSLSRWYDLERNIIRLTKDLSFNDKEQDKHIGSVRELFIQSIKFRLRSDVPVGSCLSGGIDSSSIVTVVASLIQPENRDNFQTYSAVYGNWFDMSEHEYIDEVVERTGIRNHRTIPTIEELHDLFSLFVYHQEEPVTTSSSFSQYCVMKLAHSCGAKVLLDGQGADEILAGYDYMIGYYLSELLIKARFSTLIKELIIQIKKQNVVGIKAFIFQFFPRFLQKRFSPRQIGAINVSLRTKFSNRSVVDDLLYKYKYLNRALLNHVLFKLQHLLRWEDKNAMAFSIETRVPFLDNNLVEYILALSSDMKIKNGITKWILRKALIDFLPKKIIDRTDKIGFAAPEEIWINSSKHIIIEELILHSHPLLDKYINRKFLRSCLAKSERFDSSTSRILFRILCLNKWFNVFFKIS